MRSYFLKGVSGASRENRVGNADTWLYLHTQISNHEASQVYETIAQKHLRRVVEKQYYI